jgi:hypothetical protein
MNKIEATSKRERTPMSATNYPDGTDGDRDLLLGLYHGYDQARLLLAGLVARYGSGDTSGRATQRELWNRRHRAGFSPDLFGESHESPAAPEDLSRGAHSAALTAFAAISDKAEELRKTLTSRWPSLREEAGGPLPSRLGHWPMDIGPPSSDEFYSR